MRLRADRGAEIGVFEDLQTLIIIVIGLGVLLASSLYNWSAYSEASEDQELYDAAEDILSALEAWDRIHAKDPLGTPYPDFMLSQTELELLYNNTGRFEERIRSDTDYSIIFDDLMVSDGQHDNTTHNFSKFEYGEPVPEGKETVTLQSHYIIVFEIAPQGRQIEDRHLCLVTLEVW
jgi:type II secretory pathway pseudopilin PulG